MTLYRKYRPRIFSDVVGQGHITETLARQVISGKEGHAYLFCGTRGTGKTTVAKILAQAVNCESLRDNGDPCCECSSCVSIRAGINTDVIEMDAASNNGVDNVRALRDEVLFAPSSSKYRVYIIDEVHMMTGAAFNALLKTLEEPPKHAIFILATTEAHKVPITIQSRCQRFDFRRISATDIAGQLTKVAGLEEISIDKKACEVIANLADGALRDALSLLEKCKTAGEVTEANIQEVLGVASSGEVFLLVDAILEKDISEALNIVSKITNRNGDVNSIFNLIFAHFSNLAVCKFGAGGILEVSDIEKLKEQADKIDGEFLVKAMQKCREMITLAKFSGLTKPLLESLVVELGSE